MSTHISLKLNELRPTTLAEIIASMTQNIENGDTSYSTRAIIADTYAALVANCGVDDADQLLYKAGTDPDVLFDIIAPPLAF